MTKPLENLDLKSMHDNAEYEAAMLEAENEAEYWKDYSDNINEINEEFRSKWPNHCKDCGGWGLHSFTEMHGFNHGSGEEITDPCECTENGKCPRCGKEDALDEEGQGPCPKCNWNYDDGIVL